MKSKSDVQSASLRIVQRTLLPLFTVMVAACSGTDGSLLANGGDDAGTDSGSGGGGSGVLPTGTCSLTLAGAVTGTVVGVAYGEMDGSGNLVVLCGSFTMARSDQLKLGIGNGTYNGPRMYDLDQSASDGDFSFTVPEGATTSEYAPSTFGAGCVVDLTTAPPGNFAAAGSTVAGTFACNGLSDESSAKGPALAISAGQFNAPVR